MSVFKIILRAIVFFSVLFCIYLVITTSMAHVTAWVYSVLGETPFLVLGSLFILAYICWEIYKKIKGKRSNWRS